MKKLSKLVIPMIGSAALLAAVSFLPLIPIVSSPVIPDPHWKSMFISIQGLFVNDHLMGVRYRGTWATLPTALGLSIAALYAGWKLGCLVRRK